MQNCKHQDLLNLKDFTQLTKAFTVEMSLSFYNCLLCDCSSFHFHLFHVQICEINFGILHNQWLLNNAINCLK